MDERKQRNTDSWDDAVYGTGNTQPPKSHGGLIAALISVVIFLSGIVSVLGMMNIKLFNKLNQMTEEEEQIPISFSVNANASLASAETIPGESVDNFTSQSLPDEIILNLHPSPESMDNISQEGGLSWQDIYEKNIASVVSISVETGGETVTGNGVIISRDGHIVTNSHVLADAQEITVLLNDDRHYIARIVGDDPVSDLAVLDIDVQNLTPAEFGDSSALRVGDAVAAIGDPLGLELRGTLTDGIISAINRDVNVNGRSMTLLQTNAALNTGNSGGPLVNCYGQVVGINTMKIRAFTDTAVEGLGFAIPSTTVKAVVDQLICQGYVCGRPTLGIEGEQVPKFDQYYSGIPAGIYITSVAEDSSAASQGLEKGDILVSLNGTAITDSEILEDFIFTRNIGDTVEAVIYRDGDEYIITITVSEARE